MRRAPLGHDEVYHIGVCPRCKDKDPSDILAEHINHIYDYVTAKGYKVMMWADMLHSPPTRPYKTYKAIDKIPKDILMLDFVWYFNLDRDIEDGESEVIELGYSKHIMKYTEAYGKPMLENIYRHTALPMTWHTEPVIEAKSSSADSSGRALTPKRR